jgi:hypothetical protein
MPVRNDSFFERFDRDAEVRPPSGRLFGLALALPFAIAGFRHPWAIAVCAVLILTAAVCPELLDPVSAVWTRALRPVRQASTVLAMALLFFLVVTPVGVLHRLLVRDPLRLRFDRDRASYWLPREPVLPQTMLNQF